MLFLFGHGPAFPTLADVLMLTGLEIATADDSHLFDSKPERKVEFATSAAGQGISRSTRK